MEEILAKLAESIPSTIAVIVVVVLFLREQARLQKEWGAQMESQQKQWALQMDRQQKDWSSQMDRVVTSLDHLAERLTDVEISMNGDDPHPRKRNRNA